jgi:hypothetical protein
MASVYTYDHLVRVGAAGVRGCHGGSTALAVPWELSLLRRAADGQCVHTADVAVAVAVVTLTAPIPRRPHEYGTLPSTALCNKNMLPSFLLCRIKYGGRN